MPVSEQRSLTATLGFQVTQQTGKRLLVLVVVFPALEVTNMAHPSNVSGPGLLGLHHRLVQFDGEQDQLALLLFFLEGGFDFFFYPGAFNGMLRENQQQFVMDANRLVNAATDFVANAHIMRVQTSNAHFALASCHTVYGQKLHPCWNS